MIFKIVIVIWLFVLFIMGSTIITSQNEIKTQNETIIRELTIVKSSLRWNY